MLKDWETENDEEQEPIPPQKLDYEVKAYLVLVDSDTKDWGIVEDTMNDILWTPGKGEVVGTWSRPRYNNLIHISLATSISALQDRSIQTFAKYAEERRQAGTVVGKQKKPRKAADVMEEQEPARELSVEEKLRFNSLRAKLGRAK